MKLSELKKGDAVVVELRYNRTEVLELTLSKFGRKYLWIEYAGNGYKFLKDGYSAEGRGHHMYTPEGYKLELRERLALRTIEDAKFSYKPERTFKNFSLESLEAIAAICKKEWGEA